MRLCADHYADLHDAEQELLDFVLDIINDGTVPMDEWDYRPDYSSEPNSIPVGFIRLPNGNLKEVHRAV